MNEINPNSEEPLSFETHVKPMFREPDRRSMEFAFEFGREIALPTLLRLMVDEHISTPPYRARGHTQPIA